MAKKKMTRISKWAKTTTKNDAKRHEVFQEWRAISERRSRVFKLYMRLVLDPDAHPTWYKALDAENERLWKDDVRHLEEYRRLLRKAGA